jgi:hypothetical protein
MENYQHNPSRIQQIIESTVASGGKYDRCNTERTPARFLNEEIGVQIALGNMETVDGKLDMETALDFSPRLNRVIEKFDRAGIPTRTITDAQGFDRAMFAAYSIPRTRSSFSILCKGISTTNRGHYILLDYELELPSLLF